RPQGDRTPKAGNRRPEPRGPAGTAPERTPGAAADPGTAPEKSPGTPAGVRRRLCPERRQGGPEGSPGAPAPGSRRLSAGRGALAQTERRLQLRQLPGTDLPDVL